MNMSDVCIFLKFNSKFKLQNIARKSVVSTILALLFIMLISFSPLFSVFSGVSFFASATEVNVTTEVELRNAVAGATTMEPTVITIMNDITLTSTTLTIPAGVDITLKSTNPAAFCKLTGASGKSVITVNGKL